MKVIFEVCAVQCVAFYCPKIGHGLFKVCRKLIPFILKYIHAQVCFVLLMDTCLNFYIIHLVIVNWLYGNQVLKSSWWDQKVNHWSCGASWKETVMHLRLLFHSYRNQSVDRQYRLTDWFLFDGNTDINELEVIFCLSQPVITCLKLTIHPASNRMFKVNNRNTRTLNIFHTFVLVFQLLTLNR